MLEELKVIPIFSKLSIKLLNFKSFFSWASAIDDINTIFKLFLISFFKYFPWVSLNPSLDIALNK